MRAPMYSEHIGGGGEREVLCEHPCISGQSLSDTVSPWTVEEEEAIKWINERGI